MNTSKLSSPLSLRQLNWDALVLSVAAFWLSSSVFVDFLLMPMMYETGMMNEANFATAGYSLFWLFNAVCFWLNGAVSGAPAALSAGLRYFFWRGLWPYNNEFRDGLGALLNAGRYLCR